MLRAFCLAALIGHSGSVAAGELADEARDAMLVQISSEMTECAVYYQVSAACVEKYPDPQSPVVAANMRNASGQLLILALQLGEPSGKTVAAVEAQTKLMYADMKASLGGSCANTAIILERYGNYCKRLVEGPDFRVHEIVAGHVCDGSYRCK